MGEGGGERLQAGLGMREIVGGRGVLLESMEGIWVVRVVEVRVCGRHRRRGSEEGIGGPGAWHGMLNRGDLGY